MKKTIIFLSSVFLLFVLAGCEKNKNENQNQNQQTNQNQEREQEKEQTQRKSLKDLMGLGQDKKCTWQAAQGDGQMAKGTVYVSGEKFLQESDYSQNGQAVKSFVMSDGDWMYTWSDNNKEGTKMKLEDLEGEDGETVEDEVADTEEEAYQNQEKLNEDYDFECNNWNKDNSKFIPPSDVNFQDMTQTMNQMQEQVKQMEQSGNQMMQDACSLCDSLPGSAKGECLKNCQ